MIVGIIQPQIAMEIVAPRYIGQGAVIGTALTESARKGGDMEMKEIIFPVLVLDDECRFCEELDIVSDTRTRMYADGECVDQDTLVMCSNVYKCMEIQKRLKQRADGERRCDDGQKEKQD